MKKITIGIIFIIVIIVVRLFFSDFFNISKISMLRELVDSNIFLAGLIFILIYIVAVALSLPGATILTLSGGFLFGVVLATILVNIGATIGATAIFLISRYIASDWFQKKFDLKKINKELDKNSSNYLLTLRLIPIFPFFLINIAAGLTKIKLRTFIWTTSLGIIPGSFVYAYAGATLGEVTNPADIISWQIFSVFVLLGLLSLIPVIYKKMRRKNV